MQRDAGLLVVHGYFRTWIPHRDVPTCLHNSASLYIVAWLICFSVVYFIQITKCQKKICYESTEQSVACVSSIVAIS